MRVSSKKQFKLNLTIYLLCLFLSKRIKNKALKFTVWFSATPILWYRAILIINFKIARIISVEIFLKIGLQDKIMIKRCIFSGGLDSSILKYLLELY